MNCPVCNQASRVLTTDDVDRRRQCTVCQHRFTTVEVLKEDHKRLQEAAQDVRAIAEKLAA